MYGKHNTGETKKKISEILTGRKMPMEFREKLSKRPIRCVETGKEYLNTVFVADAIGCTPTAVWNVLNGRSKTCGGYHWEYVS